MAQSERMNGRAKAGLTIRKLQLMSVSALLTTACYLTVVQSLVQVLLESFLLITAFVACDVDT